MRDKKINRVFDRIADENRDRSAHLGTAVTVVDREVLARDEHDDPSDIDRTEYTINAEIEHSTYEDSVTQDLPPGLLDEAELTLFVSDDVSLYDGSEDGYLATAVHHNGEQYTVGHTFDRGNGTMMVMCV